MRKPDVTKFNLPIAHPGQSFVAPRFPEPETPFHAALAMLLATGLPRWTALAILSSEFDPEELAREWSKFEASGPNFNEICTALNEVAEGDPNQANALFLARLAERNPKRTFPIGRLWPQEIPTGLEIEDSLALTGCDALERIGDGLKVARHFTCRDLNRLKDLPSGLVVGGDLLVIGCDLLTGFGQSLTIGGAMKMLHNHAMEGLPDGLSVERDLILGECWAFRRLPKGLRIGGNLRFEGRHNWDGIIPMDATIQGEVVLGR